MVCVLFITCQKVKLPIKHFVDSLMFLIVETLHQAVTDSFSTDSEGSSTSDFFGKVTLPLGQWVSEEVLLTLNLLLIF